MWPVVFNSTAVTPRDGRLRAVRSPCGLAPEFPAARARSCAAPWPTLIPTVAARPSSSSKRTAGTRSHFGAEGEPRPVRIEEMIFPNGPWFQLPTNGVMRGPGCLFRPVGVQDVFPDDDSRFRAGGPDHPLSAARVTMSGAWSLGLPSPAVGLRSSRSTVTSLRRAATGAVARAKSIRRPHPRWNAPCR